MEDKRADVKTGFCCNNYCRFCAQGNKRDIYGNKSLKQIKKELSDSFRYCDSVVLTGGEVTIRKDIFEIIKHAKRIGFKVIQIQSNGRFFCYYDFCLKAIDAGANHFALAIHGHNSKLHNFLTMSEESFRQTTKGIKNLNKLKQTVITNTVVTNYNYRYLPNIASLLINLGVAQFQFAFVHPIGKTLENFLSIVPRIKNIEPYIKRGLDIGIKKNKKVMTEAIPYCFMEGYEDYVAEKIIPPTKIYDANFIIGDFSAFRKKECKAKGPKCRICNYYDLCEGTWREYPERFGWNEFKPIT